MKPTYKKIRLVRRDGITVIFNSQNTNKPRIRNKANKIDK